MDIREALLKKVRDSDTQTKSKQQRDADYYAHFPNAGKLHRHSVVLVGTPSVSHDYHAYHVCAECGKVWAYNNTTRYSVDPAYFYKSNLYTQLCGEVI